MTTGRNAGMREEVIDAVRSKGDVSGLEPDERDIVLFVRQLLRTNRVEQSLFDDLVARHSLRRVVELAAKRSASTSTSRRSTTPSSCCPDRTWIRFRSCEAVPRRSVELAVAGRAGRHLRCRSLEALAGGGSRLLAYSYLRAGCARAGVADARLVAPTKMKGSAVPGSLLGNAVRRLEDPELLVGEARYVDDLPIDGVLHLSFVRSPFPHARITVIDVDAALAMPGVVAVYTFADLGIAASASGMGVNPKVQRAPLVEDEARFAGDTVAVVIAERLAQAVDATEAVEVDYDVLPAVADLDAAVAGDAPVVFAGARLQHLRRCARARRRGSDGGCRRRRPWTLRESACRGRLARWRRTRSRSCPAGPVTSSSSPCTSRRRCHIA